VKRGRKTREWDNARASIKKELSAKGITFCEMCGSTFGLTMAHRLKRRFITDKAELRKIALLCLECHDRIERLPHSEMFNVVTTIIENRV
jgi:hypothetical protein